MLTESKNTLLCPAKSASLKQGAVKCQTEKHKHSLITTFSHFFYKLRMWENEAKDLKKKSAVIFAQTVLYTNAHTRPPCHLEAVQTAQLAHVRRRLVAPLRLRFHQWQPVYACRTSAMVAAWFLVVHRKRSHSRDLCFVFILLISLMVSSWPSRHFTGIRGCCCCYCCNSGRHDFLTTGPM